MQKFSAAAALALMATTALVAPAQAQAQAQAQTQAQTAKNVILLITDGAAFETFSAASYYRFGALGREAYDAFDVQAFMATHPLNTSNTPTMTDDGAVTFDPAELWNDTPVDTVFVGNLGNYPGHFAGYDYARADFTDSAAAATALASGHKTYNNAINWSNTDESLRHIGEYVVESGRRLGVVSSVQASHATPAGFLAHNVSRNDYVALSTEIIDSGLAHVVMGSGHPLFDAAGAPVADPSENAYRYVGGPALWDRLAAGDTAYQLIETRADFEALAAGELELSKDKIFGLVQNQATLQFNRPGVAGGDLLEASPDLATMATGALNILSQDEDGFFLMVEGGAVDWAAHANNLPRLIEEQIDFNRAIEASVAWVEAHSNWDETLIIVTSDHGNGLIQGPNSDVQAYQPIVSQGQGALPLVRWHSDTHTRELVPVYAHGAGAAHFADIGVPEAGLATYGVDAAAQIWFDNTDIFGGAIQAMGLIAK